MTSTILSPEIAEYANSLSHACSEIVAIWLIGSRANGTASDTSDWDFLVYGGSTTLDCLKSHEEFHRSDVDCLVLVDARFENAWGKRKSLTLAELNWKDTCESQAMYTEAKWSDQEGSAGVVSRRRRAVRVWKK